MPHTVLLMRVLLLLTFTVSVLAKTRSGPALAAFRAAVEDFEVVPRPRVGAVVAAVLAAEAAVVAGLAVGGPLLVPGFAVAAVLLLTFSGVLVRALLRHRRIRCNCFGSAASEVSWFDVVRNGLLLAGAMTGAGAVLAGVRPAGAAADVVLAVPMAGVLLALLLSLHDVVTTVRRPFTVVGETD